jgi:hypothetical protein
VFRCRVEATIVATRADGLDHDLFHVRCTPIAAADGAASAKGG